VHQFRRSVPVHHGRWWMRMTASLRRTIVTVVMLTAVALMTAGCSGGDRGGSHHPRGAVASLRATSDHRAAYPGSAWASSKARGQAFGTIWRKVTRNPKDRDGRGIDAWTWAGRTCDAVRNGGQTRRRWCSGSTMRAGSPSRAPGSSCRPRSVRYALPRAHPLNCSPKELTPQGDAEQVRR
jgi:hypothetical protein